MNRVFLIIVILIVLTSCGKKSTPVYKSENIRHNIVFIS